MVVRTEWHGWGWTCMYACPFAMQCSNLYRNTRRIIATELRITALEQPLLSRVQGCGPGWGPISLSRTFHANSKFDSACHLSEPEFPEQAEHCGIGWREAGLVCRVRGSGS